MSKFVFFFTLAVSGAFVAFALSEGTGAAGPGDAAKPQKVYGFPDARGIVLSLRQENLRACPASSFRDLSPKLALWDDGTVVYRDSTYDCRRRKMDPAEIQALARAIEKSAAVIDGPELYTCFMRPLFEFGDPVQLARR